MARETNQFTDNLLDTQQFVQHNGNRQLFSNFRLLSSAVVLAGVAIACTAEQTPQPDSCATLVKKDDQGKVFGFGAEINGTHDKTRTYIKATVTDSLGGDPSTSESIKSPDATIGLTQLGFSTSPEGEVFVTIRQGSNAAIDCSPVSYP